MIGVKKMPYVPDKHKKYNLLQDCDFEAFEYSSLLMYEVEEVFGEKIHLMPYGFHSYEEYYGLIDACKKEYANHPEKVELLERFEIDMRERNQKEWWSILRYIGESDGSPGLGLTRGKYYYWPTPKNNPQYCGVIDDEQFTAYAYPVDKELWEIVEDPTGMAYRTIYAAKGPIDTEEMEGY